MSIKKASGSHLQYDNYIHRIILQHQHDYNQQEDDDGGEEEEGEEKEEEGFKGYKLDLYCFK